jgi:putative flippase GtrA
MVAGTRQDTAHVDERGAATASAEDDDEDEAAEDPSASGAATTTVDAVRSRVGALLSPARFGQFLSVGVVGAVADNAALVGLVEVGGLAPTVAKLGSAEFAIVLMFVMNEQWTFSAFGRRSPVELLRRLVKSNVVRAGGALVALGTIAVLHGQFGVWYLFANVAGMGIGLFVNYTFESLVTWRVGS